MAVTSRFDATNYHDLHGLQALKNPGKSNDPEVLRAVAKQFESMLMSMMLKSMRDANAAFEEGSYFSSNETKFYRDMFDQQISLKMSEGRGMGLTEILVRQLSGGLEPNASKPVSGVTPELRTTYNVPQQPAPASTNNTVNPSPRPVTPAEELPANLQHLDRAASQIPSFSSPSEFVSKLYPLAEDAAKKVGLAPQLLLAQAALETGWGKFVMRDAEGNSSFNLFGIKASGGWTGERIGKDSLEFVDGVAEKVRSSFRAYDSYAQSFRDYVDFIQQNPRYREALQKVGDPEAYADALQDAGYATDPNYGAKIKRILSGELLADATSALKL